MMMQRPTERQQAKQEIRAQVHAHRRSQAHKARLSRQICHKLAALPEYARAAAVMFYLELGSEVRTRHFLPTAWREGKRIVIPYCAGDQLELFHLQGIDELAPGMLRILEPKPELLTRPDRRADVSELDLVVVPGVAFDRRGGRIGRGKGYYDRFLRLVRPHTALVALAFECQMIPEVPMLPHDVYVHKVITEEAVYEAAQPPLADYRPFGETSGESPSDGYRSNAP
jgi:5-formyltetrahydrofolate cyclo-ligase